MIKKIINKIKFWLIRKPKLRIVLDPGLIKQSPEVRKVIVDFETELRKIPGIMIGDNEYCPLKHSFADNVYVREIFIPKGTVIVGKIHKHSHPNFLMSGDVSLLTEDGAKRIKGPCAMISPAGTKRVVFAHEDTVWITTHVTKNTDLVQIEEEIIAKTFDELPNNIIELIQIEEKQYALSHRP